MFGFSLGSVIAFLVLVAVVVGGVLWLRRRARNRRLANYPWRGGSGPRDASGSGRPRAS